MEQAQYYYDLLGDNPRQQKLVFGFGDEGSIDFVHPRTLRIHIDDKRASRAYRALVRLGIAMAPDAQFADSVQVPGDDALTVLAWLFENKRSFDVADDLIATCIACNVGATQHCGGCKTVAYCGTECQAAHWPEHKNHCH